MTIECRGRNGWFRYFSSDVWAVESSVHINLFSKRRGEFPPIHIEGPKAEILALLEELRTKVAGTDRIVIVMRKGLIDEVFTNRPAAIAVIDPDIEGCLDDEVVNLTIYEEPETVFVSTADGVVNPDRVEKVFSQITK